MSNQPAANRRERIPLGNTHLSLPGKLTAQSSEVQRSSLALLGEGGTVTQAVGGDRTTAVELNARHGVITTDDATLTAEVVQTFTVTNKYVDASSVILVSSESSAGVSASVSSIAAGSFDVSLLLGTAAAATSDEATKVHFLVLGGAPDQTP